MYVYICTTRKLNAILLCSCEYFISKRYSQIYICLYLYSVIEDSIKHFLTDLSVYTNSIICRHYIDTNRYIINKLFTLRTSTHTDGIQDAFHVQIYPDMQPLIVLITYSVCNWSICVFATFSIM